MAILFGSTGSDTIDGTQNGDKIYGWARGGNENSPSGNDTLNGRGGNDELYGGTGRDTLDGGAGVDTLVGGKDNDTYIVDSTTDIIREFENGGIDTVRSSVSYTLGEWLNNLTLTGNNAINGTGNNLDNTITGNDANNIFRGGAGNDTIDGKLGNDTIYGDAGNDRLIGGDLDGGYTTMYGGNGNDTLSGVGEMHGGNGNDSLSGSGRMYGETGDDTLEGSESQIYGGDGNDTLVGDYSNLYGGDGNDTLRAFLTATMYGGNGNDTLIGSGSAGDSNLQDYFAFNSPTEGIDTIRNFVVSGDSESRDLIVISASGFGGGLTTGNETTPIGSVIAPDSFTIGTAAGDRNDRFIYNSANGALFFDVDGTGSSAAVQIATLVGAPALNSNNIVIN